MYGLCDCNNFFASCERVFRPELEGLPVVVLSNNDGCVIARSNEAKALGIRMGHPYFQIRDLEKRHNVAVFSSNFNLYGDMSRRVIWTLRRMVPAAEVYSIDEAFLDVTHLRSATLAAREIKARILAETGLTASAGISVNKMLAKIASDWRKPDGQFVIPPQRVDAFLLPLPVNPSLRSGHTRLREFPALRFLPSHPVHEYRHTEPPVR